MVCSTRLSAPDWLPESQRAIWDETLARVAPESAAGVDPDALSAYVAAVHQHRVAARMQADLERAGDASLVVEDGKTGRLVAAPYVLLMERAAARMARLAPRLFPARCAPGIATVSTEMSASGRDEEPSDASPRVLVNKMQLAHILAVSLPTLSRWLLKYGADFPMVERGTNGRGYLFEPGETVAFLRAEQAKEMAKREHRDQELAQLRLDLDLPGVEPPPRASSAKDQIEAWKLRRLQREEAEAAGALVSASAVRDATMAALGRLSRDAHAFLRQIGHEQRWPEPYTRDVLRRFGEQQRATVAALQASVASADDEPDARLVG